MKIFKNLVVSVACVVGAMEIGIVNAAGAENLRRNSLPHLTDLSPRDAVASQHFTNARTNTPAAVINAPATHPGWPFENIPDPSNNADQQTIMSVMRRYVANMRDSTQRQNYPSCGNLLVFKTNNRQTLILQSGIERKSADALHRLLLGEGVHERNFHAVPTDVWDIYEVIARLSGRRGADIRNIAGSIVNGTIYEIATDENAWLNDRNVSDINTFVQYLVHYIEGVPPALRQDHDAVTTAYDTATQRNHDYVGLDAGQRDALAVLQALMLKQGDTPQQKKNKASALCCVLLQMQGDTVRPLELATKIFIRNTINNRNINLNRALKWLRYAFHTEIQLAVLIHNNIVQLQPNSPVFSLLQPCPSCEAAAPLNSWSPNNVLAENRGNNRFISFSLDAQQHLPFVTNEQQYCHQLNESPAYLVIDTQE